MWKRLVIFIKRHTKEITPLGKKIGIKRIRPIIFTLVSISLADQVQAINKTSVSYQKHQNDTRNSADHLHEFVNIECVGIFKHLGAGDKVIKLWTGSSDVSEKILASSMVQGMKDAGLSVDDFNELYMKYDVLYLHEFGKTILEIAGRNKDFQHVDLLIAFGNKLIKYKDKFSQYDINQDAKLKDDLCKKHLDHLGKLSPEELMILLLSDMMPYICFGNYLAQNMDHVNNPYSKYSLNFVPSEENNHTFKKFVSAANEILEELPPEIAAAAFRDGIEFEEKFIQYAMDGKFAKLVNQNGLSK